MTVADSDSLLADVHSWSMIHWVGIVLSLALAALNVYLGYSLGDPPFFAVGCSFLVGVAIYFTRFWRPVLYLLGLIHLGVLGVLWLFSGLEPFVWGVVSGVLSIGLGSIALYLFFQAETSAER